MSSFFRRTAEAALKIRPPGTVTLQIVVLVKPQVEQEIWQQVEGQAQEDRPPSLWLAQIFVLAKKLDVVTLEN